MIDQTTLKSIEDLHRLKTEGVITEEEFDRAKEKLLFGPKKAATTNPTFEAVTRGLPPMSSQGIDDLLGWMMLPLKRYAEFHGRSSRKEYWLFQLAVFVVGILAVAMIGGESSDGVGGLTALALITSGVAVLGLIVPLLALQVRRFHDQDKSGWFVLINLIPYVGALIVFIFMLIEGTVGDNQYGADPTLP